MLKFVNRNTCKYRQIKIYEQIMAYEIRDIIFLHYKY